jgi:3-hydroxyisobutyrate dehydrogenase-like beta-hydroxyacid dehydrogenase
MDIAVLGLGEAGSRYATDLVALGIRVTGFDPADISTPAGVVRRDTIAEAISDSDLVIGFTGARVSLVVAEQAALHLRAGAVFADFNTGSPAVKREIEAVFADAAGTAADVAVLAPVPRAGVRTPLLASGPGAEIVASFFSDRAGSEASAIPGPMGAAAGRKLLRSVFMKGLAAVVIEADEAARIADAEDWLRDQMAAELGPDGSALIERLITGTRAHAERRLHEMEDTSAYLEELGSPRDMSTAATAWLARLAHEGVSA